MPASQRYSIDALAAAALSANGRTQNQIAAALNVSQSAVSRLLRPETVQEYIVVERHFRWEKLPQSVQQEVRKRMSQREIGKRVARLAQAHNKLAPAVTVVPVDAKTEAAVQFESFAAQAAVALRDLLREVRGRVGVAWGSTLWHTTRALQAILPQRPAREAAPVEFVPLCGDPLMDSEEQYADRTSSRIVSELSKSLNGDIPRPPWLGLVPAFIPRTFKPNEIRVIDHLIDLVPQYSRIFGPRLKISKPGLPPIAGDLHMIITAAGPAKRPLGFGRNPLLGLTDSESRTLAANIHGDIGGVLLPRMPNGKSRSGEEPSPHPLVVELTRRWTGLKLEHLEACSSRAFSEQSPWRPGVTLLTFGASRMDVVIEAVRRGLVNHLIIGSDLEEALAKELDGDSRESERRPAP